MRALSLCTAESYRFNDLHKNLQEKFASVHYRQVVYIKRSINERECEIFYFPFGVVIIWGSTPEQDAVILNEISEYEINPLNKIEDDEFIYSYGNDFDVKNDHIFLPDNDVITKLAISHAMAQSVKLSVFEITIQKRIELTKQIPQELVRYGRISLSKKETRQKMGEIFLERSSINLHFDLLDTPEFFWENVKLEPIYLQMAKYLDLKQRVDTLNNRLRIVHELFEMLGKELDTQHGSRLEWIIIILIFIEIFMNLAKDIF